MFHDFLMRILQLGMIQIKRDDQAMKPDSLILDV